MSFFQDAYGRDWVIRLTPEKLLDIKSDYGIDLAKLDCFDKLATNVDKLPDLFFTLCEHQASRQGVTRQDFIAALAIDREDILMAANSALFDAWQKLLKVKVQVSQ
jgi:hypothetical protein